ncbi:DUF2079 domain-containing protein [Thermococcus atlanticus]
MRLSKGDYAVLGMAMLYIMIFFFLQLNIYHTFRSLGTDLGIFTQAFWNTIHGNGIFYNNIEWQLHHGVQTHFGVHNSPILFLLLPAYYLFPRPQTLLFLQTLVIGLSAYPLYLLAREVLRRERMAVLMALLYLFNPALHGINLYDFHAVPFAMPFIFLTAYFMEKENLKAAFISVLLVLSVKEDAGLAVLSLGLFYLLKDGSIFSRSTCRKFCLFMISVSLIWILLSIKLVIPHFAPAGYEYTGLYGKSCSGHAYQKILFFLLVNLSWGMLTFLRPKYYLLLAALPWAEMLASCRWEMFVIGTHYPYMVVPLSFISIIYALRDLRPRAVSRIASAGMIIGLLSSAALTPALPFLSLHSNLPVVYWGYEKVTPHHRLLGEITGRLEKSNYRILTQNDIFPHLANNAGTYFIWIDLYRNLHNPGYLTETLSIDIILLDSKLERYNTSVRPQLLRYFKEAGYLRIIETDGIQIYVRKDLELDKNLRTLLHTAGLTSQPLQPAQFAAYFAFLGAYGFAGFSRIALDTYKLNDYYCPYNQRQGYHEYVFNGSLGLPVHCLTLTNNQKCTPEFKNKKT